MFAVPGIDYIMEMLPWALGVFVALVLLFIFWKIWRAVVSNRVRKIQTAAGMQFSDIDRMRKTGGITEEEYKRIRQAMARQTMQAMEEQRRIEAERSIFERARMNPEAAREFLRTGSAAPAADSGAAPGEAPATPPNLAATPDPTPPRKPLPARPATAPAAQPPPRRAPTPSMNMPRVVQERRRAQAQVPPESTANAEDRRAADAKAASELDVLLAKGAISKAEYDRLKQFFK